MCSKDRSCQLCGCKSKSGIEIFGHKGLKLRMKSILYQHFSLEFTDTDKLSKIVCKKCWKITDDFHQLYSLVKDGFPCLNHDRNLSIRLPPILKTEHSPEQLDVDDVEVKLENSDQKVYESSNDIELNNSGSVLSIKEEKSQQRLDGIDMNCVIPKLKVEQISTKQLTAKQLDAMEKDKEIHSLLGFICELCNRDLVSFLELKYHFRREHKMTGYVRCCKRKYKSRSVLYDHIQDHKNPVRLQCPVCDKKLTDKNNLIKHIKSHDPASKTIPCPNCPKLFETTKRLNSHIEWIHSTRPKSLICDICAKGFISKLTITRHLLNVHVQKYSQICDICAKRFKSIRLLDLHYKKKHLGIQMPKVQCDICGAWLSEKKALRKHVQYHYAKEEICPICGKKAPNRNAMGNHMRKVHSGRIYPCTICEKKFKSQISLKEHISTHTGYNLYRCKYCDKEFNYDSSLYKHRKDMHPIEFEEDRRRKIVHSITPIRKIDAIIVHNLN